VLKGTYIGNDVAASPGAVAAFQWQNLTPGTISQMIQTIEPAFDPTQFSCQLGNIGGDYAVFGCYRSGQDSYAWIAVLDLGNRLPIGQGGTGRIVALPNTLSAPATRWCGLHSVEPLADGNWIGWTPKILNAGVAGKGPFTVRLLSSLPAATGQVTVKVSGEPLPLLINAEAGDVFRVPSTAGYDLLKIIEKRSPTEWVVDRTVVQTSPAAVNPGPDLQAFCSARLPNPTIATAV
jgi:hypothetical protein